MRGMRPLYYWAELDNYADTSFILSTLPYVESFRKEQQTFE